MRYLFVLIVALFLTSAMKAQVHLNLNLNLGTQPTWGPTGYDHVENYYLPDIDAYYCVPTHLFYYFERGRWISRAELPPRFHNIDLYSAYKVVVNERNPWRNPSIYREKYASFKGRHDQEVIRNSHDSKYFVNKDHPQHDKWMKEQKHEKSPDNRKMKENNRNKDVRNRDKKENMNRDKH